MQYEVHYRQYTQRVVCWLLWGHRTLSPSMYMFDCYCVNTYYHVQREFPEDYSFFPRTWILPSDLADFKVGSGIDAECISISSRIAGKKISCSICDVDVFRWTQLNRDR